MRVLLNSKVKMEEKKNGLAGKMILIISDSGAMIFAFPKADGEELLVNF